MCHLPYYSNASRWVGEALTFGTWCFLVAFGASMEASQLGDGAMCLVCDGESPSPGCERATRERGVHGELTNEGFEYRTLRREVACHTTIEYKTIYNILHVVGGVICIAHLSVHISHGVYLLLLRCISSALFMCRSPIRIMLFTAFFASGVMVYQHVVYNAMFCHLNATFCDHPPQEYDVIWKLSMSFLTFSVVSLALQALYVGLFSWMFVMKRMQTWTNIIDIEDSLLLNGRLDELLENRMSLARSRDISNFVTYWMCKPDDDIIREIPAKTRTVLWVMRRYIDVDRNSTITRDELNAYVEATNNDSNTVADVDRLWSIMTFDGMYESITADSLEDLLYELFFDRKKLACMIHTDLVLLTSLILFLTAVTFPACAIVVCKIFEYNDAFSQGVDLFKTYAIIVSFLSSRIMGSLQFLWLMFRERPFNIGDVLQVGGGTYNVTAFNSSHTFLYGATSVTISNNTLLRDPVVNLSKSHIAESLDMQLPLESHYEKGDMEAALRAYMHRHPRDVKEDTVRCGWTKIDGCGKTLRLSYRYKFKILDRSRLNDTRTRIINHMISDCTSEVAMSFVVRNVASGGGMSHSVLDEAGDHVLHTLRKLKNE